MVTTLRHRLRQPVYTVISVMLNLRFLHRNSIRVIRHSFWTDLEFELGSGKHASSPIASASLHGYFGHAEFSILP